MFNNSKYTKWYNNIIDKAKNKASLDVYQEKHHIIPKSLGGGDDEENMVNLTAKEHYIVHHLLTKMVGHKDKVKMWNAFFMMHISSKSNRHRYITARGYEYSKSKMAESKKLKKGELNHFYGKKHSDETKVKMKASWNKDKPRNFDKKLYKFHHKDHGTIEETRIGMIKMGFLTNKEIYKLVHGHQKSSKGWILNG